MFIVNMLGLGLVFGSVYAYSSVGALSVFELAGAIVIGVALACIPSK